MFGYFSLSRLGSPLDGFLVGEKRTMLSDTVLVAPLWLLVQIVAFRSLARAARLIFPSDSPTERLLHVTVLYWASVVVSAILPGCVGLLYPPVCHSILLIFSLILAYYLQTCVSNRHIPVELPGRVKACRPFRWVSFEVLLLLFLAIYHAGASFHVFPTGWDTLMYHLPLIDQWCQRHSLYAPNSAHWWVPGNLELLGYWIVGPFSGDFLFSATNLLPCVVLVLAANHIMLSASRNRCIAAITTVSIVSSSVIQRQMFDVENDVALSALFLTGAWYILRYMKSGRTADIVLAVIVFGLLAGIKYYALAYAAIETILLLTIVGARSGRTACIKAAIASWLAFFLLSGYWYFRNACLTGSPFFPSGIIPGSEGFLHLYPDLRHTSMLGNGSHEIPPLIASAISTHAGSCHFVGLLIAPIACLIFLGRSLLARHGLPRQKYDSRLRAVLSALTIGSAIVLSITPFAVEDNPGTLNVLRSGYTPMRYGLSFFSLSVIMSFLIAYDVVRRLSGFMVAVANRLLELILPSLRLCRKAMYRMRQILVGLVLGIPIGVCAARQFITHFEMNRVEALIVVDAVAVCFAGSELARRLGGRINYLHCAALSVFLFGLYVADSARHWHREFNAHYSHVFGIKYIESKEVIGTKGIYLIDYLPYPYLRSDRRTRVINRLVTPTEGDLLDADIRQCEADVVIVRSLDKGTISGWCQYEFALQWFYNGPANYKEFARDRAGIAFQALGK